MKFETTLQWGMLAGMLLLPSMAQACATCGCTLSSEAATGYAAGGGSAPGSGWMLDVEYSYIDQSQLRAGMSAISPVQAAALSNGAGGYTAANPGPQEIERRTINRYTNVALSYAANPAWNFTMIVPYVDRTHGTYGNVSADQINPANVSDATAAGLGDMQWIATWQGALPTHNLGLQIGIKLPTGNYGNQNLNSGAIAGRSPTLFYSGPNAGVPLDASLQTGTGSTDLILGAFYYQPVSQNFDAFVQGRYQVAMFEQLDQPGATYRPGNLGVVSVGVRYEKYQDWTPQLQVNLSRKSHDMGALADSTDTAGTVVYVSPGISVRVLGSLNLYTFIQVPVYSQLDGYQLFPRWTGTVGMSLVF